MSLQPPPILVPLQIAQGSKLELNYPWQDWFIKLGQQLNGTSNVQTLTWQTKLNWDVSKGSLTFCQVGGNFTLNNPTNLSAGTYLLVLTNAGGRTVTWGTAYKFPSASGKFVLSSVGGATDIVTFVSDGKLMYAVGQQNFQ